MSDSSATERPSHGPENSAGERLLGDIVKQHRLLGGLTLEQLALLLGTSKGYIHDIESGRASNPSFDFTMRLFGVLNLSADAVWRKMA